MHTANEARKCESAAIRGEICGYSTSDLSVSPARSGFSRPRTLQTQASSTPAPHGSAIPILRKSSGRGTTTPTTCSRRADHSRPELRVGRSPAPRARPPATSLSTSTRRWTRRSLSIPGGSSATSPMMCFSTGNWHFRFVARGNGAVRVTVRVRGLLGVISILDGGTVWMKSPWRPSPRSACPGRTSAAC